MEEENKQHKMQEMVAQIESHRKQLDILNQQIQLIENGMMEIRSTLAALEAIEKNKVGAELIVPIGSGSFIRANLADNKKVLVGVGADISIEKTTDGAKALLDNRAKGLTKTLEGLQKSAVELTSKITGLNEAAQAQMADIQS